MINSHQFQQAAKQFRAGRISLKEFTDLVIGQATPRKPNEEPQRSKDGADSSPNAAGSPVNLPKRRSETHKGDYGRVVAIGGSVGMAGAIGLTGLAALRAGSGMVKAVVPDLIQTIVSGLNPCLMTVGCPSDQGCFASCCRERIESEIQWADTVAVGPGLGRCDSLNEIVSRLYASITQPMVIDADGLNVLSQDSVDWSSHAGPRILTPHPGEFQRIVSKEFSNRTQMEESAKQLAASSDLVVVLKGNRTYVSDGTQEYRNQSGNPGMATAGSGDVLTGVVSSLLGQGIAAFDAAVLGVHLHGVAGDFAAEVVGETSLMATDLVEHLPMAFKKHANHSDTPIGFQTV